MAVSGKLRVERAPRKGIEILIVKRVLVALKQFQKSGEVSSSLAWGRGVSIYAEVGTAEVGFAKGSLSVGGGENSTVPTGKAAEENILRLGDTQSGSSWKGDRFEI